MAPLADGARTPNVNSAFAPGRITGPGGFSVIATGSPRVYFAGAFTAGKRDIRVANCRLSIAQDGPIVKFVKRVFKVVFNAGYALEEGKVVMYITERAVFKLTLTGVELVEAAPGVGVEKDVTKKMEFAPKIGKLEEIDKRLFCEGKLGLRREALRLLRR